MYLHWRKKKSTISKIIIYNLKRQVPLQVCFNFLVLAENWAMDSDLKKNFKANPISKGSFHRCLCFSFIELKWLIGPKKTLGFEGDFAKGNAVKESRQNSEEVLGVEILSDTTLTRGVGILSTLTMSITEVHMLQKSFCLLIIVC